MNVEKPTEFTPKQLADWRAYEKVRCSGKWNMYMPQARRATGLSEEKYNFAVDHYEELRDADKSKNKAV